MEKCDIFWLISIKDIPCIYFFFNIVQASIVSVCDNCLAFFLEGFQVIDYFRTKECVAGFEGWLIDDDLCTFGFDSFHNSLDGRLPKVIGVVFHS